MRSTPNRVDSMLDLSALREAVGGEEAMVDGILRMARAEVTMIRATLHEALRERETDLVRRKAHLLRGFLMNLGATPLVEVAERMERSAQNGTLGVVRESMGELDLLLDLLEEELDRRLLGAVA